jgi:hypothetical protein
LHLSNLLLGLHFNVAIALANINSLPSLKLSQLFGSAYCHGSLKKEELVKQIVGDPEQFKANQEEQAAQYPNVKVQVMTEKQVAAAKKTLISCA